MLLQFVQWLNETSWSTALREGDFSFPLIETVHILALGASVGTIMWIDLRLMGIAMKRERISEMISQLEPWAIGGFIVMFISGALLLLSEPLKCYTTLAFRLKVIMLFMAGANVWIFHRGIYQSIAKWDDYEVIPWQARLCGFASMVLWFGIIIAGRWTAYF